MTPRSAVRALHAASPTTAAVLFMVVAGALFASMHGMVRLLTQDLHPFVVAFYRNLFGFAAVLPFVAHRRLGLFQTRRFGLHLARGLLNGSSMLMWFTALSIVPLADATALTLTGPLFVTLGAMAFLGEKVRAWRWTALLIGASGALFILRPGFETVNIGMILALIGTASASCSKLMAKSLTRTDPPAVIAALLQFLMMLVTLVAALFVWEWPSWIQFGGLALIGTLGGLGHLCLTKAYSFADISFAEPIVFLRMVWATLFGFLVFAELPDIWTWIGAGLIVAATSYIAQRERAGKRAAKRAAAPAE